MDGEKNTDTQREDGAFSQLYMRELSERLFLDSKRYGNNMGENIWNV